jgi:hypothetical protein
MKLKKLPIGIQTFRKIREEDYLYIDKTDIAYELINSYSYSFLSRPRRFGKSLFLDTLRNIFEGNKELFEGLAIYDKWDWDVKYPVIKISWDGRNRSIEDLKSNTRSFIKDNQRRLNIVCDEPLDNPTCFKELIQKAYAKHKQQVVILIDEYDKPILDVIEDVEQAKEHREYIKGLYSTIKGCDEYVKFAFLTGVSKFSKASIFSGLNMLTDISLDEDYGNICGYTQDDIETSFLSYLDGVDMERMKNYYNGYNFLKDDIYNPFDTLQFIANKFKYKNYWFATGTPTYLIKLIKENNYYLPNLLDLTVGEELLDSFDVENIRLEVILYQAGYLTIDEIQTNDMLDITEYKLKVPNKEVQLSLNNFILEFLYNQQNINKTKVSIFQTLQSVKLDDLKDTLVSLFASIPHNNYTKNKIQNYEGHYASILYVYFASLGIKIIGEDVTNLGRIDLTLFVEDKIYILEFKVDGKKGEALQQIKDKEYAQKYLSHQKDIYLVGIEFSKEKKNIVNFEWERI